jgi:outer membrane protein assembly factor BamB
LNIEISFYDTYIKLVRIKYPIIEDITMQMLIIHLLISFFVLGQNPPSGDEWPDWRGYSRDGTWNENGVLKTFDFDKFEIKWSAPVSSGYSGPTIEGGRVYLTDRQTRPEEVERVLCFDAENGNEIWTYTYDCEYVGVGYPAGPRASVIVEGPLAYSLGTMGNLFCFNKENGDIIWGKDLNEEYKIRMPIWGIASAPILIDDKIILIIGGEDNAGVVALDRKSGKEVWRNLQDEAGYSAPVLVEQAGQKVLVVWTAENIAGLDPESGKVFWIHEFKPRNMPINIATPVLYKNYLFFSSFYDGSILIELNKEELKSSVVWRRIGKDERNTDALHCCISTPLILNDYIYGVDSYGELRCLDLLTGDRIWEDLTAVNKDRWANIHFIQNGDLTYMFNEHGELIISKLSYSGYHEISRAELIEPTTTQLNRRGIGVAWAHPGFAYKHVFIRSDKELTSADLSQ